MEDKIMEVTDLRVGNYVSVRDFKEVKTVVQIKPIDIYTLDEGDWLANSIVIDNEWFRKFGCDSPIIGEYRFDNYLIKKDTFRNSWGLYQDYNLISSFNYVHEFQNIIYILTKIDLETIN